LPGILVFELLRDLLGSRISNGKFLVLLLCLAVAVNPQSDPAHQEPPRQPLVGEAVHEVEVVVVVGDRHDVQAVFQKIEGDPLPVGGVTVQHNAVTGRAALDLFCRTGPWSEASHGEGNENGHTKSAVHHRCLQRKKRAAAMGGRRARGRRGN